MKDRSLIIANWKMNKTINQTEEFFKNLDLSKLETKYDLVICPPFTSLEAVKSKIEKTNVNLGAQNCFWEEKGAFTGEISACMLANIGVKYVIVGHSERRNYFLEDNEIINKKINIVLENKMKAVLCVGEPLEARCESKAVEFVMSQLKECLCGIRKESIKDIIIAYEPIWSIGTGKAINPQDAEKMCKSIRNFIAKKYDDDSAKDILILYGGSLNPENFKNFIELENINGGLIGGASLDPQKFMEIINH